MYVEKKLQQRKIIAETSGFGVANDEAYFLNSQEIKTVDNLLTHGQDYLLFHIHPRFGMEFTSAKFLTARENNGWVVLYLENNLRPGKMSLSVPMLPGETRPYPFVLTDINYLAFEINQRLKQKGELVADIVASMYETPGWERILRIIQDETAKMLKTDKLLDFEF